MDAEIIQLPDRRNLAYAEYGAPDGVPVFWFHGTPGSRLVTPHIHATGKIHGLRLISPDRPGYGYSDFKSGRSLLDWSNDVVAIADELRIEQFGVVGTSGGGPYAVACAYKLGDRLKTVGVVSSLGPTEYVPLPKELRPRYLREFDAATASKRVHEEPQAMLEDILAHSPKDLKQFFENNKTWALNAFQEIYRQGIRAEIYEDELFCEPWEFSVEEIQADVHLWCGEVDHLIEHNRFLASKIPRCNAHFLPEVGHFIPDFYWNDIFSIFENDR